MESFGLSDLIALLIGLAIFVALGYLITYRAAIYHFLMSRSLAERSVDADIGAVSIPVSREGMPAANQGSISGDAAEATADMDAVKASIPPGWRDISNEDLIVLLAVLRGPNGKPRLSANKIYDFVGGDRNTVLARVREVRSGPPAPVYSERTEAR